MDIVDEAFELMKSIEPADKYMIESQILRSAISIPSNVAEGASRSSEKDFARFLEIALGSSFELETQVQILKRNIPGVAVESIQGG